MLASLKVGRKIFNINEKDIVLFNGACWMLITRTIWSSGHYVTPTMSKTMCKKLVKNNVLIMYKKEREYITANGEQMGLYYYKFDIKKLKEFVNK